MECLIKIIKGRDSNTQLRKFFALVKAYHRNSDRMRKACPNIAGRLGVFMARVPKLENMFLEYQHISTNSAKDSMNRNLFIFI